MQRKNDYAAIWSFVSLVILAVITLGLFSGWFIPEYEEPNVQAIVDNAVSNLDIPTEEGIAALITIPSMPETFLSLREELKSQALDLCDDEFDLDDLMEDTNLDDDYEESEISVIREYTDDRYFYSVNLGIDNEDNKRITVYRVYKIDVDDDYKDKVYTTCQVTSDDGELEAEMNYTL